MPGFRTRLILEVVGNREFVLAARLVYEDDDGTIYEVPTGQRTDLGSTWGKPLVSALYDCIGVMSCVLHDWAYRTGKMKRSVADQLLYNAMYWEGIFYEEHGYEGISDETRLRMYQGVRMFGASSYQGKPEDND